MPKAPRATVNKAATDAAPYSLSQSSGSLVADSQAKDPNWVYCYKDCPLDWCKEAHDHMILCGGHHPGEEFWVHYACMGPGEKPQDFAGEKVWLCKHCRESEWIKVAAKAILSRAGMLDVLTNPSPNSDEAVVMLKAREDGWKRRIHELADERDQALKRASDQEEELESLRALVPILRAESFTGYHGIAEDTASERALFGEEEMFAPKGGESVQSAPEPRGAVESGGTPTDCAPTGSSPTGDAPKGSSPMGDAPTGSTSESGARETGSTPTDRAPIGSAPKGAAPSGSRSGRGAPKRKAQDIDEPGHSDVPGPSRPRKRTRLPSTDVRAAATPAPASSNRDQVPPAVSRDTSPHHSAVSIDGGDEIKDEGPARQRRATPSSWTPVQENIVISEMRQILQILPRPSEKDMFGRVAAALQARGGRPGCTWIQVKNTWNRRLRERSGVDERRPRKDGRPRALKTGDRK